MGIYDVNGNLLSSTGDRINDLFNTSLLISHRGGTWYPENTMIAAENAVSVKGYKAIEFDFQFTSDNVCVALHDTTINRTGRNSDGSTISTTINISSITYAQALNYDFGIYKGSEFAGEKIPTLKEFLLFCKEKGIVAELDLVDRSYTDSQYASIYTTVKDLGMLQSTIFALDYAKANKIASLDDSLILAISSRTTTALIDAVDAFPARLMICSCPVANINETLPVHAHQKGYTFQTWTANSQSVIDTNRGYGVDYIFTDSVVPT